MFPRSLLVALLCAVIAVPALAASYKPGDRQFAFVQGHDPVGFERAVKTGADLIKAGDAKQFRVYLIGRAVLMAIPGVPTVVQKGIIKTLKTTPGLKLVACKETVDAIIKLAHQRPPFLPNTIVETCKDQRQKLESQGWQLAIGF